MFLNNALNTPTLLTPTSYRYTYTYIMIVMNDNIPEIDAEIMGNVRLVRNKGTTWQLGSTCSPYLRRIV